MTNLYFIETDNYELLNMKVSDILKQKNITSDNLIVYDMEEINVANAIMDLDTYNLFGDVKVVLCKNSIFLTAAKSEINHDISLLERYLSNPITEAICYKQFTYICY